METKKLKLDRVYLLWNLPEPDSGNESYKLIRVFIDLETGVDYKEQLLNDNPNLKLSLEIWYL